MRRRSSFRAAAVLAGWLVGWLTAAGPGLAQSIDAAGQPPPKVERLVILKVDGLPEHLLEQYLDLGSGARLARAGRAQLPWIDYVFARNGTWLENFYTRGLSLSATSWSILDTGRHASIRGNVEYDRYTLRPYDYLNFFPFYLGYAARNRVDMPGVELLDELGIKLLLDRFPYEQRYQGFQLLQRGVRWSTLQSALNRTLAVSPRELLDEWQTGISLAGSLDEQAEHELMERLADPKIRYLDLFLSEFDHAAHLTRDPVSQFHTIEQLDGLVGRIWGAIEASPLADSTALVLVSDHGMNTSPEIYSQGFNLVDWFGSLAGGGHHVVTNRHPLTEFTLKGLDPLVNTVITPGPGAGYLVNQQDRYPTVMLDLDGNERASIGLRSNALNQIHLLLDQLLNRQIPGAVRTAALNGLFEVLDQVRQPWQTDLDALREQLAVLDRQIIAGEAQLAAGPQKWTDEQIQLGQDKVARRAEHQLRVWQDQRAEFASYADKVARLLRLDPADFDPGKFKIEELVPTRSLGPINSVYDLRNYVTGLGDEGLVLAEPANEPGPSTRERELDWERSFRRIDYFPALTSLAVRNNLQRDVSSRPVDFVALTIPVDAFLEADYQELFGAGTTDRHATGAVWLWRGEDRQALVLARRSDSGIELRYVPVARLTQDAPQTGGAIRFDFAALSSGLPLEFIEDPEFALPPNARADWLGGWHSEREWLNAVHRTRYSTGIVSLAEHFLSLEVLSPEALLGEVQPQETGPDSGADGQDSDPLAPFRARQARLRETDLLVLANDHWNFNVRGFNPGGNHGSFFRTSTHSVLLLAGGDATGIPRGRRIEAPYDGLSLVPTLLELMGQPEPDLPGPVIEELIHR